MKRYIKNDIIYSLPVQLKVNNKYIYTTDDALIKSFGYEEYTETVLKPTLQQLIEQSDKAINARTDERILNDFVFEGNEFYLTIENQTNFANMFIAKQYLIFPQVVKTKTGFYTIKDAEECTNFYLARSRFCKRMY